LNYLNDDGLSVEPDYYLPNIPMILVNGGKGIGTGYSYEGLCYNPKQIMQFIKNKIKGVWIIKATLTLSHIMKILKEKS
jgi:DNA topoisomerase-2